MEDPAWAWPAWKFDMKREDLFTTLQNQYNTFSYTLQDPEAFYHDVYEISCDADTADEFHRMMGERRQLRLRELNESLETLAVEIIANPKLMGSKQWNQALQLFRTKSYDSVVRYFATYIPDDYFDRHDAYSTSSSSSSFSENDSISTATSCVGDAPSPFTDDNFFPTDTVLTTEPHTVKSEDQQQHHECRHLSPPPSEASQSESSLSSPINSLSRSMSFSESDSGHSVPDFIRQTSLKDYDETTRCDDDCDTATTSLYDSVESLSALGELPKDAHQKESAGNIIDLDDDEDFPTAQYPEDDFAYLDFAHNPPLNHILDSDTPTPRSEAPAAPCLGFRSIISKKTSSSTLPRSPLHKSLMVSRGTGSSTLDVQRRPKASASEIQKPVQDLAKKRRRID